MIHELWHFLDSKFNLFSGVFGASDEVLSTIESGLDFVCRVLEVYQQCRSLEEITAAFKKLQDELDEPIRAHLSETRKQLLEHFDEDVHERLKMNLSGARDQLGRIGRMFSALTRFELTQHACFDDEDLSFDLEARPSRLHVQVTTSRSPKGRADVAGEFLYRFSHPQARCLSP